MLQIYTGSGKGKTSAAIGVLSRAKLSGMKVFAVFFDKIESDSSDAKILQALEIEYKFFGENRILLNGFRSGYDEADKLAIEKAWEFSKNIIESQDYQVILLDEIINCLNDLKMQEVLGIIMNAKSNKEIILTGRNAPNKFVDASDLVTEMEEIKHYFNSGINARKGIDY